MNDRSPRAEGAPRRGSRDGQARRLLLKRDREGVEGADWPLDLDDDAVSVVSDVAAELEPRSQAMDERPEADTLNDAACAVSSPLEGRCFHSGSLTEDLEGRNRCGLSADMVGIRADVRSTRIGDRLAQEVPLDAERTIIPPEGLAALVDALRARGYRVIGPRVEQQAIVYGELEDASELPVVGPTSRRPRPTAWSAGTTRHASATPSGRTPGSSLSFPHVSGNGVPSGTTTARSRPRRTSETSGRSP